MDNGLPALSMNATSGHHRNTNTAVNGNNSFARAAAALAAAAAASQQHIFNAAIRAAAVSSAPFTAIGADAGSGGSNSPLSVQLDYGQEAAEAKLIDYRQEKVAAFEIDGETMMCLPQAYELFLKNLVGGLHTVYTKLKRLEIAPFVCNVEQVRALRSIGAIQPGVNRCKLISCRDFDVLFEDCASSSSRPGRPPKRSPIFNTSSATMAPSAVAVSGASAMTSNNGYPVGNGVSYGLGNTPVTSDYAPTPKRSRLSESSTASAMEKFNTTFNPMANFMNPAAMAGGNALNPNQLFPPFLFAPQNFMLSQIMGANPNSSLLAKQWSEQFGGISASSGEMDAAIDATMKGDRGQSGESAQNLSATAIALDRGDRNIAWSSPRGRESEDLLKFPNNGDAHESSSLARDMTISGNGIGIVGPRQSGEDNDDDVSEGNNRTSSDFEDADVVDSAKGIRDSEKDDEDRQTRAWTKVSASGGTEASQLLRSMADLGVNSPFFGGPPSLAAAAVAAAAATVSSQQNGRHHPTPFSVLQTAEQSHYSSVENILFSVLGLVQVAASTARAHEEQMAKEKMEAVRLYEIEKQERGRLEQVLRDERHWKAVYLKRLKKERKQKTELTEKLRALTGGTGQQAKIGIVRVSASPDSAKPSTITNSSRSASSTDTSPSFLHQSKGSNVSISKQSTVDAGSHRRPSSDGSKNDSATSPRLVIGNSTKPEPAGDMLERCGEGARYSP